MNLRVFHIDFNSAAAAAGCNAILWEVEDKVARKLWTH